jgi:hypothetical protein
MDAHGPGVSTRERGERFGGIGRHTCSFDEQLADQFSLFQEVLKEP